MPKERADTQGRLSRKERRAQKQEARDAKRAAKAKARERREARGVSRLVKVVLCALVLVVCVFMALTIGDADYHATLLGWSPLLVAICLIVFAFIYIRVASRSLEFHESAQLTDCERGEKVPFYVTFENKGLLVLFNVQVEIFVADANGDVAQTATTSLALGPHAHCEVPFDIPFDHVGMFAAGLRSVRIVDFLGLFERKQEIAKESHICVLPKVPHLGSQEFSDDSDVESLKTLKTALADSLDYAYVRDYEPGDPLKTIHWKLSARTDHYMTRLFEKSTSPGVIVLIDFYALGREVDESMELRDTVLESAIAIADYAYSKGMDTELRYMNRYGEKRVLTSWGEDMVLQMIEEMPQATGDEELEGNAIEQLQEISADARMHNNVIVCSANVGSDMVGTLISSKQMRKSPFFAASVPRRLVDRDLERYLGQLSALEAYRIPYEAVSSSEDLEGKELR